MGRRPESVALAMLGLGALATSLPGCASLADRCCGQAITARDSMPRTVTVLDETLTPLAQAFNAQADRWRVVALVSPTCSECAYGAEAVQKEIGSRYPAKDVAALIVWIPMLPSDNEPAARASATIFPADRARQFYDSRQAVGWGYARQTLAGFVERARTSLPEGHWLAPEFQNRRDGERPQWDLYMLYAPGVRWTGEAPPVPTHWIRHLGRGEDRRISTYWLDTPESGPRDGNLFDAMRRMADEAVGKPSTSMNSPVKIEVLGFSDCPNTSATRANVTKAVAAIGLAANVVYVAQRALPESDTRRGWPAPTVLVDGNDLFGLPKPEGSTMGCRVYPSGAPTEAEITRALKTIAGVSAAHASSVADVPLACTLTQSSLAERKEVFDELMRGVLERRELRDGIAFRFAPEVGIVTRLSRVVDLERECCRFLAFRISVEQAGGPVWLEITGPPSAKSLIEEYFDRR